MSLDGFGHASVGGVREAGRVGQRGPETGAGLHHVAGAALPNPGEGGVQTEAGAMAGTIPWTIQTVILANDCSGEVRTLVQVALKEATDSQRMNLGSPLNALRT